ncbi:chitobiosyldiphosphodolichol beta-mannosyltransferase [Arthroderma uncinatum]|uniref:chitobiosyldiphosphodolichol beta-mannosyltransferase n=1 Tax=Arthroderma uncinatum TaxID=74035 RepID=UPI00144AE747|nr:chitobiosyldiphosphodolichol beta-mannosyltransferase [Arthroderma uncinatum]KAF3482614.1 chitobiosyldiphosphodolichol beta-mannosyltransferase [Arthroderma uncinatum]
MLLMLALIAVSSIFLLAVLQLRPTRYGKAQPGAPEPDAVSVQIVVLGDIGHSPRMQCHALSIARHGGRVSLIGYHNSTPNLELVEHPLVSIVALPSPPRFLQSSSKLLFPVVAVLKVLHQTWHLWAALAYRTTPAKWMLIQELYRGISLLRTDCIYPQNPPAAPTLAIAQLACRLRNTHLIIDWHNFGYSILALKLGAAHPMVKLMAWHEYSFSHFATAHFCVSNAMARVLREQVKVKGPLLVLHDRPPTIFNPILDERERLDFLSSLPETSPYAKDIIQGRCRLLISSTSWTPDEDFSLLVDALCRYSNLTKSSHPNLPSLLVIITGKGPQKEMYLSQVASLTARGELSNVSIKLVWLAFESYARLLACASLGVCLHTSSSGVDLPMKVVDMFGAGLPVIGWDRYEAWPELVTEGVNGKGFDSADKLLELLTSLFGGSGSDLKVLRDGAIRESRNRWDGTWDPIAGKLFDLVVT